MSVCRLAQVDEWTDGSVLSSLPAWDTGCPLFWVNKRPYECNLQWVSRLSVFPSLIQFPSSFVSVVSWSNCRLPPWLPAWPEDHAAMFTIHHGPSFTHLCVLVWPAFHSILSIGIWGVIQWSGNNASSSHATALFLQLHYSLIQRWMDFPHNLCTRHSKGVACELNSGGEKKKKKKASQEGPGGEWSQSGVGRKRERKEREKERGKFNPIKEKLSKAEDHKDQKQRRVASKRWPPFVICVVLASEWVYSSDTVSNEISLRLFNLTRVNQVTASIDRSFIRSQVHFCTLLIALCENKEMAGIFPTSGKLTGLKRSEEWINSTWLKSITCYFPWNSLFWSAWATLRWLFYFLPIPSVGRDKSLSASLFIMYLHPLMHPSLT